MVLNVLLLAFLPLAASPESEGVSSRQLLKWLDASESKINCLHGFVVLRHGKLIAEGSWKPYDTLNEPHRLSSHTKCFVTTAVGFLADEGKLDIDERVVDILPDLVPASPSENLRQLRVRDLMTMNLGSSKDECWLQDKDGDWGKAMLAGLIDKKPGTYFEYDSGATHLLGLIVQRRSKEPLWNFVKRRIFDKLGIEKAWTTYDPLGNVCAAWGFSMTTREMSLIGQLYLNRGLWNGERLLSEDWTTLATTKQTYSGSSPTDIQPKNDWTQGFGFNFWRCQHGCYRADGSGGQYTIVFPQHDAVLSLHSDVSSMQDILDVVWDEFLPALKARCANLALPTVRGSLEGGEKYLGRDFKFTSTPTTFANIKGMRIERKDDGWKLHLATAAGPCELPVGFGKWAVGTVVLTDKKYECLGDPIGTQRVASSAAVQDDGTIRLTVHLLGGPRRMDLHFCKRLFKPAVVGTAAGSGGSFKTGLW